MSPRQRHANAASNDTSNGTGATRRDFLAFCTAIAVTLGLGPGGVRRVQAALASGMRPPIIWLHFAECTACTEAALRMTDPAFDDLILTRISLDYHETLMVAAGHTAEALRNEALIKYPGEFFCIVEGSIPTAAGGIHGQIGGRTMLAIAEEICSRARGVIALGSCACDGGIAAAAPNPTGAKGVKAALPNLTVPVINCPGCPPNPVNFEAIIVSYLLAGTLPPLDASGRPVFAYGKVQCDSCEYRNTNLCLSTSGCQGPFTYHNCGGIKFNEGTSFCPQARHVCIGCSEPGFWDTSPFWTSYGVTVDANKAGKTIPTTATITGSVRGTTGGNDAGTTTPDGGGGQSGSGGHIASSSSGCGCAAGGKVGAGALGLGAALLAAAARARRTVAPVPPPAVAPSEPSDP